MAHDMTEQKREPKYSVKKCTEPTKITLILDHAGSAVCKMYEGHHNFAEHIVTKLNTPIAPVASHELVRELVAALKKAVKDYGKPGGPWNVPNEPGTWIALAHAAIQSAEGK